MATLLTSALARRGRQAIWRDPLADLPERIRQNVRKHSAESERLIGWVQLTLAATFATLSLPAWPSTS